MLQIYVFWLLVETSFYKLLELPAVVSIQLRWRVLWDEEKHPHGVHVRVRRLAFGQFDGGDAQGPNVGLGVVRRLLDHLRIFQTKEKVAICIVVIQ